MTGTGEVACGGDVTSACLKQITATICAEELVRGDRDRTSSQENGSITVVQRPHKVRTRKEAGGRPAQHSER